MNKWKWILLTVIVLCLGGCSSAPAQQTEDFSFHYNNLEIRLNADVSPVINALGEPTSYTEEPSCAFDGLDKTYFYGSFYLSTYPLDGEDYVYSIWFADDTVATPEGIRIGMSQPEVEAICGTDSVNGTNVYVLTKGDTKLTILLTDGAVSSIQYSLVLE